MGQAILDFIGSTGIASIFEDFLGSGGLSLIMIVIALVLFYLGIVRKFEPLLLIPIAFGMLLTNLPGANMFHFDFFSGATVDYGLVLEKGGLLDILYLGVKLGVYPPLIFLGIGAMTDFSPLIANPKTIFLGAAAQLGIFLTFAVSLATRVYNALEAASIGIIGGADGPTAIYLTKSLAPSLLPAIAVAAYSYMALVPLIQPPIMRALTTKKERAIVMDQLRPVSKTERIVFPILVTIVVALLIPDATPLVGCLMLGNLLKESGVADRLVKTASNELMNIVTIFLGVSVGATAIAENFLSVRTLIIIGMGLAAFCISTAGGVLFGKLMCWLTKGKINPLIGSAGVSAVPMAARVSNTVGLEENPNNYLLMHAMGPNVAGVIGSAVAAGVFMSMFG
jgi:oxaloacetate decarboxylase beta subunit